MKSKVLAALVALLPMSVCPETSANSGRLILVPSSGQPVAEAECTDLLAFVRTRLDLGFPETQLAEPVQDVDQPEPDGGKYVELSPQNTSLLVGLKWLMDGSAVKVFGDCHARSFYISKTGKSSGTLQWYGPYEMPGKGA